jgi:hypothetical protein
MVNISLIPVVCNTAAYAINKAHAVVDFSKQKQSAIAADVIAGEADFSLFVSYWKKLVN